MKRILFTAIVVVLLASNSAAQTTFTYQGSLKEGGNPASGGSFGTSNLSIVFTFPISVC